MSIKVKGATLVCKAEGCGIAYIVPQERYDSRAIDKAAFYCPNGHEHKCIDPNDITTLEDVREAGEQLTRDRNGGLIS